MALPTHPFVLRDGKLDVITAEFDALGETPSATTGAQWRYEGRDLAGNPSGIKYLCERLADGVVQVEVRLQ